MRVIFFKRLAIWLAWRLAGQGKNRYKRPMNKSPRLSWKPAVAIGVLLLLGLLGGCSAPGAYVHRAGEFNRAATGFGQPPKDIKDVTVCYSSWRAEPQDILALAQAECVTFGKTAVFTSQDWRTCPLATPVAAKFSCVQLQ